MRCRATCTRPQLRALFVVLFAAVALLAHNAAHACSMFTWADADTVLFANNEDYIKPGVVWFSPARDGKLARINFGFEDDFAQGAMNERGLCFDCAALPKVPYAPDPALPRAKNVVDDVMDTCATVDEAIARIQQYQCDYLATGQFMFADATGAAAVVTWDHRGALSIVRRTAPYLLITNDRLEYSGLRDERFVLGARYLDAGGPPTPERCAEVLRAMHQRGPGAYTSYAYVMNPRTLGVTVYNMADFDNAVHLDLREELARGTRSTKLRKLFPNSATPAELERAPRREHDTKISLSAEQLARFAGRYKVDDIGLIITIAPAPDGELLFTPEESKSATLFPESEHGFRFRGTFGTLTFDPGSGPAPGFTLHRPADSHATRID